MIPTLDIPSLMLQVAQRPIQSLALLALIIFYCLLVRYSVKYLRKSTFSEGAKTIARFFIKASSIIIGASFFIYLFSPAIGIPFFLAWVSMVSTVFILGTLIYVIGKGVLSPSDHPSGEAK